MTNTERIQANNEALEEAIAIAQSLPDAGAVIEPLNVTKNGTYSAPTGVDGYSPVTVNVPIPDGYIKPSGTLNITQNGSHDVTQYATASVNVPVGATVQRKSGTFTTNSSGSATVNCGFKPDLVLFDTGQSNYNRAFSGMPFAEASYGNLEMLVYHTSPSQYIMCVVTGSVSSTGFSITSRKINYSAQQSNDSNRSFSYTAVKYT